MDPLENPDYKVWNITDDICCWSDFRQQVYSPRELVLFNVRLNWHIFHAMCKKLFFPYLFSHLRGVLCCWLHVNVWRS